MSVFMLFGIFAPCIGASDLHEHLKEESSYMDEALPLNESMRRVYAFVEEHCDEIYAYAYAQVKSAGVIDELNAYLDKAVQAIRCAENSAFGYEAYFRSEDLAPCLRAVADETVNAVEALRDLLVNADSLDAKVREKASVLLEKLPDDLHDFASLIRIVTEDAFVYADAVKKREIAKVRTILNEKLNEIREAAAFAESVLKEHAATADALVRNFIKLAEKYDKNFSGNKKYTEEEFRLLLKQFLGNAFSADYRISSDSFYLAIGEDVLYAEILAKRLGLSEAQFGVTGWNDTDSSLIAKADLITVGYSESMISGFAADQILCYIKNYADGTFREALGNYAEGALRHLFESMTFTLNEAVIGEFRVQTGAILDAFLETFENTKSDTMDWAALIGEENAKYADALRKTIKESLMQSGIPESETLRINVVQFLIENADQLDPSLANILYIFKTNELEEILGDHAFFTHELPVLDLLAVAAEAYLYGYVKFNIEYARLVYAIGVINPNARVVLLGNDHVFAGLDMDIVIDDMTISFDMLSDCGIRASFDEACGILSAQADSMNAFQMQFGEIPSCINGIYEAIASTDVTVQGASFDLGEILGAPILAHALFYAFTKENVIFVDVSDAQTIYENASAMDFLLAYIFDRTVCNVSESGHAYIAEQIYRALRIVCGHGDWDDDHLCNYCGKVLSVCANKDGDHLCDLCGAVTSECADADNDHKCDLCGAVTSECADADNDHKCNLCGAVMSKCADTDNDHKCNVCYKVLGECADTDNDHACDICGKQVGACEDENNDHLCDICGLMIGACGDADDNHVCDICGKVCSECADLNNDHQCDVCRDILSECSYGEWIVTKEATGKEEGDRYRECLICGQRDHDVIPKLGLSVITVVIIVAGIVTALGGAVFAAYRLVYKKKNVTVETDEDEWIFS